MMGVNLTYRGVNITHVLLIIISGLVLYFFPFEQKVAKFIGTNIFALGLRNVVSYHYSLPLHWKGLGRIEKDHSSYRLSYYMSYFVLLGACFFFAL